MKQLDVFITSTCYDLIDLRAELAQFLRERGFLVRLSEDPFSDFSVEPTADSIESCLVNVEASDVVVCIIDRRYGGVLKHGKYAGKSATHAEVEHAQALKPPKPLLFFVRDRAANDYGVMRENGLSTQTRWVVEKDEQRLRWFDFFKWVSAIPEHASRSNWYDPFRDSVELKRLVLKRLSDRFPQAVASLALSPDRLVRITFIASRRGADATTVSGHFQNVGVGPALNLTHGTAPASLASTISQFGRGGLAERESIQTDDEKDLTYESDRLASFVVFCEYENRFGDRYRVEQTFSRKPPNAPLRPDGDERLFVAVSRTKDRFDWRQVYPISDL